jgi:acetylornithine deacetylase
MQVDMNSQTETENLERISGELSELAGSYRDRLIHNISELVQIPSENTPPVGAEGACQRYLHGRLKKMGLEAELYEPTQSDGLENHPVFRAGRDYTDRPNLIASWPGTGGGRSLLLSGHIDTVPKGSEPWKRDPFGAQVEGNRLYGLGSNDMKGGIGASLLAIEMLRELGISLKGRLMMETIVDEEFGGVNGTLAARLRGYNADAAIICEPSQSVICPAQTGGRTVHITLRGASSGILYEGKPQARSLDQLQFLLGKVEAFALQRRSTAPVHPLYAASADPVPVWITKINYGGWGPKEPVTIPTLCRVEMYWQLMPGEEQLDIELEFFRWLDGIISERPDLFPVRPDVDFPIRWLPGSAIDSGCDLVRELAGTFAQVTGRPPEIQGIGGPCDMFVFHQHFLTPAVLFGPRGGNTHAPDEWVDLDSALLTAEILARFICRWCGVDRDRTSS